METTKIVNLAQYIDHTLLKPDATTDQIKKLCHEAAQFSFKGICVNSHYVPLAHSLLKETPVLIVSVIGFPLGACLTEAKAYEAKLAEARGANEIDMVINIGAVKEKLWAFVEQDIAAVTGAVKIPVKVILETALLTNDEIVMASEISEKAGARFVKTCTGFSGGGATVEHIQMMRKSVSPKVEVKASGGIKTHEQAIALISAGATRLGTSSGVQLVQGLATNPHTY